MNSLRRCLAAIAIIICFTLFRVADSNATEQERELFLAAEKSLQRGQFKQYQALSAKLKKYPLLPYLRYAYLDKKWPTISPSEVSGFLEEYKDTPLTNQLREKWLIHLAEQNNWATFLKFYRATANPAIQCGYHTAQASRTKKFPSAKDIESLWLVGAPQPEVCEKLFKVWHRNGALTENLVWQRITRAVSIQQFEFATQLADFLPFTEQTKVSALIAAAKTPMTVLASTSYSANDTALRFILLNTIKRLAWKNPDEANTLLQKLDEKFSFTLEERAPVARAIALSWATDYREEGLAALTGMHSSVEDSKIREWRLRLALRKQDWQLVLSLYNWLNREEQASNRWQYWKARALEHLDRKDEAQLIYSAISAQRDYYSFLAADRINKPYNLQDQPLSFTDADLAVIGKLPGVRRAHELWKLNRQAEARREWSYVTARFSKEKFLHAAKLLQNWGWLDQAIAMANRGGYMDDVVLRFPLIYQDEILQNATAHNLEPAWIYGLVRQESAFISDARSPKGALGLMQLMPETAKQTALWLNTRLQQPEQLLQQPINIKIGVGHLRQLRNQLNNNPILATAAYNAGAHKVGLWLNIPDNFAADLWVETIPYEETRDYVQRVMAYTVIYQHRLHNRTLSLKDIMPNVLSVSTLTQDEKIAEKRNDNS